MATPSTSYEQLPDIAINPIRILAPEGQMLVVTKGTSSGRLDDILLSVSGYHFRRQEADFKPEEEVNWEGWDILPDTDPETGVMRYRPSKPSFIAREWGWKVVGFGKGLFSPDLKYSKWERGRDGKWEVVSKDRHESVVYWQYNMAVPVLEVEGVGNVKSNIFLNVIVRIVNPYKALFLSGGWIQLMMSAIHGAIKPHVADMNAEELRKGIKTGDTSKALTQYVKDLNGIQTEVLSGAGFEGGLRDSFGIQIMDVRFADIDVKASEKMTEALEAEEVARLELKAADKRAEAIRKIGEAGQQAYGSGDAYGRVREMEILGEALKVAKPSVVVVGGGSVPPVAISTDKK